MTGSLKLRSNIAKFHSKTNILDCGLALLLVHIRPALADAKTAVCTKYIFASSLENGFFSYAEVSICGENNVRFCASLQRAALREFSQVIAKRNDKGLLFASGKNAGICRPCSRRGPWSWGKGNGRVEMGSMPYWWLRMFGPTGVIWHQLWHHLGISTEAECDHAAAFGSALFRVRTRASLEHHSGKRRDNCKKKMRNKPIKANGKRGYRIIRSDEALLFES